MKKKGWTSLTVKLNTLIIIIVLVLSLGLAAFAYNMNSERVDKYYTQTTSNAARAIAAFVDGDKTEDLLNAIKTDEFVKIREEAMEADGDQALIEWLQERGLYDTYTSIRAMLKTYKEKLGAEYVYLQSLEGTQSINIVDPDEAVLYTGSYEDTPEGYEEHTTNEHIDSVVSHSEYGWLCSAYEPVVNSKGQNVAIVGVDINMNDVMDERQRFLTTMMVFAAALMIVSSMITVLLMRRIATKPLSMLAKATTGFVDDQTGYLKEKIINLPINSKDEIGDLYEEIRGMQGRIVEYLDNLTTVTAEKERIGAELNIAAQIQADMLPRIFPPFPERTDFDIYATMDPAREVGGDFYDFFLVDDDHLCMVIADVSGKGVPAALFMMASKIVIANNAKMGKSPAQILTDTNASILRNSREEMFITVWLGILELSTGRLTAANAGHEYPVLQRPGEPYRLFKDKHDLVLGGMEGIRYRQYELTLAPGSRLFVYTDGVPEAANAQIEMFGTERMLTVLNQDTAVSPEATLRNVRRAVDDFVQDAEQFDDLTMLCLEYKGPEAEPGKEEKHGTQSSQIQKRRVLRTALRLRRRGGHGQV